jgi:hypothetical protein
MVSHEMRLVIIAQTYDDYAKVQLPKLKKTYWHRCQAVEVGSQTRTIADIRIINDKNKRLRFKPNF